MTTRADRPRSGRRSDEGFTLTETLVAMIVFSILLAIFMTSVVAMVRSVSNTTAAAENGDQVRSGFLRLDREVRYAELINAPRNESGHYDVVYLIAARGAGVAPQCHQWRLSQSTGLLQTRTWAASTASGGGAWRTVAEGVVVPAGAGAPFVLASSGDSGRQQLTVSLQAGRDKNAARLTSSFVARNTGSTVRTSGSSVSCSASIS